jgi:hypothetical protein
MLPGEHGGGRIQCAKSSAEENARDSKPRDGGDLEALKQVVGERD